MTYLGGLLAALVVAGIARQMKWLTTGGAIATALVGFVIFGLGGPRFAVPLLVFFLSSSLLSKIGNRQKAGANALSAKGTQRDAGQVWANGGMAVALVLVFCFVGHLWPVDRTRYLLMLFLAALATVNADTWATEIGSLSSSPPISLKNGQKAAPGTSGAVSALGLFASALGAIVIPLSMWLLWHLTLPEFMAVAWAGFLGCLTDSVFGASVQAKYRDPLTGGITEKTMVSGQKTTRLGGLPWINNDLVNFLASACGVLFAWLLLRYSVYLYQ